MHRISRVKCQRGQSLVEFAMVLPVMFMLVAAGVDLSSVMFTKYRQVAAAREGLKLASEATDPCQQGAIRDNAVRRIQRVLTTSGMPHWDPRSTVNAQWIARFRSGIPYTLLEVDIRWQINYYFAPLLRSLGINAFPNEVRTVATSFGMEGTNIICP